MDNLKQTEDISFQEELAKTYFSTISPNENHLTQASSTLKNKKSKIIPISLIVALLISLVIVTFLVLNRIEIDVKIIPAQNTTSLERNKDREIIYLSKNGELNREIIKEVIFYENADIKSGWGKKMVILSNEDTSKKAILGINFNIPLDMGEDSISFYAKGKSGGEDLRISLRDSKNNFCNSKINELQNTWQQFIINAEQAKDFIDTNQIIHIDFVVNPAEKQKLDHSTVYFKDICVIQ